jgi:hypothetical protein
MTRVWQLFSFELSTSHVRVPGAPLFKRNFFVFPSLHRILAIPRIWVRSCMVASSAKCAIRGFSASLFGTLSAASADRCQFVLVRETDSISLVVVVLLAAVSPKIDDSALSSSLLLGQDDSSSTLAMALHFQDMTGLHSTSHIHAY